MAGAEEEHGEKNARCPATTVHHPSASLVNSYTCFKAHFKVSSSKKSSYTPLFLLPPAKHFVHVTLLQDDM